MLGLLKGFDGFRGGLILAAGGGDAINKLFTRASNLWPAVGTVAKWSPFGWFSRVDNCDDRNYWDDWYERNGIFGFEP